MADQKDEVARMEERAWASFALHAGQRLTTFNFFIVLSSLLINALVVTLQRDFRVPYVGVVIGLLLAVLASSSGRSTYEIGSSSNLPRK